MIDLYCERTTAGLLAEPWNAASNLAFLVAALAAARAGRHAGRLDVLALAGLLALIALGSAAFHIFATAWAQWLDVLPIVAFQLAFLAAYLQRVHGLGKSMTAGVSSAFFLTLLVAAQAPPILNGSLAYVPAAVVLGWVAWDGWRRTRNSALAVAAVLFPISLAARTVDLALCPLWPRGTHWAWHLLNALVLWLVVTGHLRSPRHESRQSMT